MSTPDNFLGLPEELSHYGRAAVAVLPVPYEHTVSYAGGTAQGPRAIITASQQVELYDEELGCEPCDVGVATLPELAVKGVAPGKLGGIIGEAIGRIVDDGKIPLMLGGEHSITPAAVSAVQRRFANLTVVQFDAHADLRQEYEGEPHSHACAMARVREICPAVQVGIRNLSSEEARWVRRDNLPLFFAHQMRRDPRWMEAAIGAIATEEVYVTFDVDVFDAGIMPATGTPEPGGISWYEATDFLKMLFERKRVRGMDIVELSPREGMHGCDFLTAKLAYKCVGYLRQSELRRQPQPR